MFLTPAIFTPEQWKRALLPIVLTALACVLPRTLLELCAHSRSADRPLPKLLSFQFCEGVAVSWSYL